MDRDSPGPQIVKEPVFILAKIVLVKSQKTLPVLLQEGHEKNDYEGNALGYCNEAQNITISGKPENLFF